MDGAPGARARGNWDMLVLGIEKGGPRCAKRWLVLILAPAQQKSLLPPLCSPQWSAASPFPPQCVWLLLALISCALSPSPCHHSLHISPPSVHCTARLPMPQRLRPPSLLHKCLCQCSHASQLISLILCASLCSPLQRAVSHPKVFAPLCPQCGCNQSGGMETSRPAQGPGTGARLFLMAMVAVVPRCLLNALLPKEISYPGSVAASMGRALRSSKSRYGGTPCSPISGKPPRWVPVPVAGGCSVQGPLRTCVLLAQTTRVLTGCHGVSASLWTRRVHLCAQGTVCPAVPICKHRCTRGCAAARARCAATPAALPAWACAHGQSQAPLCWHAGFRAPGSRCAQCHSQPWHA